MSKFKSFLQKVKGFCKRNAYALVVSFCVLAVFSVVTAVSVADLYKVDNEQQQNEQQNPPAQQTGGETVIIFDSPVKDGTVLKDYYEDEVVEDKTSGVWKTHQAIDYSGVEGTKILAAYDGTVESVENSIMDGTVITIVHNDNLKTVYKSCTSDVMVKQGDTVTKGAEIGVMGTCTSEKLDGIHLHFEVWLDGKLVDPNNYLSSDK